MSDNRAHEWLDDATAERLLCGDHGDPRAEALARLLSAAAAPAPVDAQREEIALAAFRAAREEGRLARPGPRRYRKRGEGRFADRRRHYDGGLRAGRPVRALAGALLATVALGGVAMAAATGALNAPFASYGRTTSTAASSAAGGATAGAASSGRSSDKSPTGGASRGVPTPADSPAATADARGEALCRAWAASVRRHQAMDAKAYERLVSDAGGRAGGRNKVKVQGYCTVLLGWNGKQKAGDGRGASDSPSGLSGKRGASADQGDKGKKSDKSDETRKVHKGAKSHKGDKSGGGSDGKRNAGRSERASANRHLSGTRHRSDKATTSRHSDGN